MSIARLRVLLVPDSVHWITGTIAKSIVRFNPWIEGTIVSGPVLDRVLTERPEFMQNFDLVHFLCPYVSKSWSPRFRASIPCVTSHYHVTNWEDIKHNLDGDAIMIISRQWETDLQERGGPMERVVCVPAGVDAETFLPTPEAQRQVMRRKHGIPPGSTVIGFFAKQSSNDHDRKGVDIFTQALLGLRDEIPDLAALIVGPGWHDLVKSFREAGIRCLWFPFIRKNDGLRQMYALLDFYWVTARVEGGPVTLLEAMSSEVCCVTTPVGLAREIVTDGVNAALVPMNDPGAVVQRTAALVRDAAERQRLARNGRQTILEHMHLAVTMTEVAGLYERAFETFAARQQQPAPLDVRALAAQTPAGATPSGGELPLCGFPVAMQARIRMLENLAWGESLLRQKQWSSALGMIGRECIKNPASPQPWRTLARNLLPGFATARLLQMTKG